MRQTTMPVQTRALHAIAAAVVLLGAGAARAQVVQDSRFQPLFAPVVTTTGAPASLLDGQYAANARVGQLRVEVRGAGAPADGVTPVTLTVTVLGRDGVLLKEPVLVTIEHSGSARLQMQGSPTDEFGPSRKDADRRVPGTQLKVVDGTATFSLIAPSQPEDVVLRL
ncbi:MAG: hypothetical protein RLZZ373_1551, partial [Pseudomonadota bacterium]